jgi:cytochrome c-type biogenesis protein CcmH
MTERSLEERLTRRGFVARLAGYGATSAVALGVGVRIARAQGRGGVVDTTAQTVSRVDSSNLFAMDQLASRPVRRPPKPGATASMTADERDALEHRIRCQCGCTLDVYTCRTTDFSCAVSPAMHADVMSLVQGGYDAKEILEAFVGVYGERALMAPNAEGFNLLGWTAPFVAVAAGAVAIVFLLKKWRRESGTRSAPVAVARTHTSGDATDDELARLEAAVRDDE